MRPPRRKQEPFDRLRGRHKKHASAETQDWNRKHLPPKIKTPPWMDEETARKLAVLRHQLDPWNGTHTKEDE